MLDIIYEDKYILAVHKPVGIPSQTAKISQSDVVCITEDYLRKKTVPKGRPYVGMINRLDQPVEGIVLMGLDPKTTAGLTAQLREGKISKKYLAGVLPADKAWPNDKESGSGVITLTGHIFHDKKNNFSQVVSKDHKDGKYAELKYELVDRVKIDIPDKTKAPDAGSDLASEGKVANMDQTYIALADIELITGRHHQIRVQMANAGLPLLGDKKYAPEYVQNVSKLLNLPGVALCAYQLHFTHPVTNDIIDLRVEPQGEWYSFFKN
ncbi:MAG: RluA family pseudouridine synthase [Lachnospiraceae bacterium]|nr:RluA family pseudouridine synthase [Lachnospiraceae bacterium]